MRLPFTVKAADHGLARLTFELDAADAGKLEQILEQFAPRRAA